MDSQKIPITPTPEVVKALSVISDFLSKELIARGRQCIVMPGSRLPMHNSEGVPVHWIFVTHAPGVDDVAMAETLSRGLAQRVAELIIDNVAPPEVVKLSKGDHAIGEN